jgi:hypothetical protein
LPRLVSMSFAGAAFIGVAEPGVSYSEVVRVIDVARSVGVEQVGLAARPDEGGAPVRSR